MFTIRNASFLLLSACLFSGCSSLTNLTPSRQVRSPQGLYPFEVSFENKQQTLRPESLKAYVILGYDSFPMEPTRVVKNRWEATVPIPADVKYITYRYKFDFEYYGLGKSKKDSKLTPSYELKIVDR